MHQVINDIRTHNLKGRDMLSRRNGDSVYKIYHPLPYYIYWELGPETCLQDFPHIFKIKYFPKCHILYGMSHIINENWPWARLNVSPLFNIIK